MSKEFITSLFTTLKSSGQKQKLVREPYASSGRRWNHATTILAASWMPVLTGSYVPATGLSTTGSKEMMGSQLRKHVSTCSTTFSARTRPLASSWS
jgi:hypothetical protein